MLSAQVDSEVPRLNARELSAENEMTKTRGSRGWMGTARCSDGRSRIAMRNSFALSRGLRHEMISGGGAVGAVQIAGRLCGGTVKGGGGAPRREVLAIRPFWHLRLQRHS